MSSIPWLADVLRAGGCKVVEHPGWKTRGRPATSGAFNPVAVLIHHTGTTTSKANPAPTVPMCIRGRPDLPGPLCQAVLGFDGVYHVIAAGRANHAGMAKASGPVPGGDGNALYIGIEVDYSGSQDMGPDQYDALIAGTAAILKKLSKAQEWARGHKETSSAGKWDPGRHGSSSPEYRMDAIRQDVKTALQPPRRPRFELLTGEGKMFASSIRSTDDREAQAERLLKFLAAHTDEVLDEMDHDEKAGEPNDVRIRRVWA